MKARAALTRARASWVQAIAAPGAIADGAVKALVEAQHAIDVIDHMIEELEDADELEAEEEE
jgi:hypothetical protein